MLGQCKGRHVHADEVRVRISVGKVHAEPGMCYGHGGWAGPPVGGHHEQGP